jgi:lysophospholipase L1-like esterase
MGDRVCSGAISRVTSVAIHGILVLAVALVVQGLVLRRGNTLHDNGRWDSAKVALEYGILGSVAFLTTRTALHANRLDLGVWHGYHELLRSEPVRLAALDARLRLRGPGYLVAVFGGDANGFDGVRVSSDPTFPAACLRGTPDGGFDSIEPLDVPLLDASWHSLSLEADGASYRVRVDGRDVGSCGGVPLQPASVGFRSGAADHAEVDDVVIRARDGASPWREDFANHRDAPLIAGAALLGVLGVHALVLLLTAGARRRQGLSASPYILTTHLVLLCAAGLAWGADLFFVSPRHPDEVDFRGRVTTFERKSDVVARLREEVVLPKPEGVVRILALGGSQTWGSGARTRADTWFEQLEALLNGAAPDGVRYEVVSAGIPAYTASQAYELYEREWIGLDPDVVLVNAGHNDRDDAVLAKWVRRIAQLGAERGIRTVVVPEANSVENRSSLAPLLERHAALRAMAADQGLPVIETHEWLVERRDQGFLWWDRVHLTPYGQRLLAQRLFDQRETLLGP